MVSVCSIVYIKFICADLFNVPKGAREQNEQFIRMQSYSKDRYGPVSWYITTVESMR